MNTNSLPLNVDGTLNDRLLPSVGNGHIATNVWTDTLFLNGVYNGYKGDSYRENLFLTELCSNIGMTNHICI